MLKLLIVDDELDAIEALEWKLNRYIGDVIIAKCNSPIEAIELVESFKPDILFLDIHMPELNGFEFLMRLSNLKFNLIFTTAYDEMAIRVSKLANLLYILKPVDKDDLIETIEKAKQRGTQGFLEHSITTLKKHITDYVK